MEKAQIDYTKYRLKPAQEIKSIVSEVSSVFIVHCKKCYKEFEAENEPECINLANLLADDSNKIKGCSQVDFLCNKYLTGKELNDLNFSAVETVGVISCGLGIQLVAQELEPKRVLALADSIPESGNATSVVGYHGVSLGPEKCAACGQCYLNMTGGICPIVDCAKSLLNGPCGGAKNGKCEVNSEVDCAWEKIYLRVKGKAQKPSTSQVKLRDYQKFKFEEKKKLSEFSRNRRMESFYGGVYPLENKEKTQDEKIENFPDTEYVAIFLSQHTGSPAEAIVKKGSKVRMGEKIGEARAFLSLPVHSSVSGKVVSIENLTHPAILKPSPAIIIENDGLNQKDTSVKPLSDPESISGDSLVDLVKEKGICGLGGAMFPTHVKLTPPKPVDTVIVNGCECEPYLNADNRLMIEYAPAIVKGIEIVQKILNVKNVVIGVEENKPEAIKSLVESGAEVKSLKTKYPQGAEKILIKKLLGREVPKGGLPFDVGVVVFNVGTLFSIYQAIYEGIPLIKRVVTISGEGVKKSGNYLMRIGTPLKDVIDFSFEDSTDKVFETHVVKMGGPMMGILQKDLNSAVIKGTTGFTILEKYPVDVAQERECIKCGRCVEVCPVELHPNYYSYYGKREKWEETMRYNVQDCIECGACEYICSSKIALLSFIKKAKRHAYNKTKG